LRVKSEIDGQAVSTHVTGNAKNAGQLGSQAIEHIESYAPAGAGQTADARRHRKKVRSWVRCCCNSHGSTKIRFKPMNSSFACVFS
jgi:hypothetical protein